jgi:hypothetical protein
MQAIGYAHWRDTYPGQLLRWAEELRSKHDWRCGVCGSKGTVEHSLSLKVSMSDLRIAAGII